MVKEENLIHALANCRECVWAESGYRTAIKEARAHAKLTGHYVTVETAYCIEFNPKTNSKNKRNDYVAK